MEEKKLVEQVILGKKEAINKFYKIFRPALFKIIKSKIDDSKDAEEVLQDTFVSAFTSLPLFNFRCSLLNWLKAIAFHEIADFYRKKKLKTIVFSHLPFLEKLVDQALGPELALQEKETKEKIKKTLKNLSEGYRQILRLKYIEGLSVKEIAQKLGENVKAVESRLFRARLAFQKEYCQNKEFNDGNKKNWQIYFSFGNKRKLSF